MKLQNVFVRILEERGLGSQQLAVLAETGKFIGFQSYENSILTGDVLSEDIEVH